MTRTGPTWTLLLAAAACASGCTITQMKTDNKQHAARVETKTRQVQDAERTNAALQADRERLLSELQAQELSVAQLTAKLREIEKLHASTVAQTERQRQRKAERERLLKQAEADVKAVQQTKDQSNEAKTKRLETARQQLRKTLELIADS